MKNKITGSFIAKFIGVLLLCILGACIVFNSVGLIYLNQQSFPDGLKSYFDTSECASRVESSSYSIFDYYNQYGRDSAEASYDTEYSNISFQIDEYDKDTDSYKEVASTTTSDNTSEAYVYYIATINNEFYFSQNKEDSYNTKNYNQLYRITSYLKNPLTAHDEFYSAQKVFNTFYFQGESNLFIKLIIEFILFLCVLIFEFCAAGHSAGTDEIHTLWIDKIPYEIFMLISFWIFYATLSGFGISLSFVDVMKAVYASIAVAMFISLNIYLVLMTTTRRIKSHTFLESFISYKIIQILVITVKSIPVIWKVSIPVIIYWFIEFVIIGERIDYGNSSACNFHLLIVTILSLVIILCAYEFSIIYKAGKEIINGNKNYKISEKDMKYMVGELKEHAQDLNELSEGIGIAVEKEMKSERLKTELITNVSHDIKTPLTSIINYTDLLTKDHTEEEEKQYLEVLSRQSNKLKKLIEDLVEASKASSGNVSTNIVSLNVKEIIDQSVAEYSDKLETSKLETVINIKEEPIHVYADGRLLWRVLSNLLSNVTKYALAGTRVYIDVERKDNNEVCISMKNISKDALNINTDELMERFVRGDSSRHTEGSGLGLNIVKSLVEVQKGRFDLQIDGDLFKALIYLPESK